MWAFDSRKVIFLPAFCIILGFVSISDTKADERAELQGKDLTVVGQKSSEPTAKHLFQLYPRVMTDLKQLLGWELGYKPTVVLVEDRETFERMGGSPYISAYAVPRERTIVLNLPALSSRPYTLNETFKHEVCHLVLHDHIRRLPRWLDEGVCQWVSGSLGELLIGQKDLGSGAIDLSRHAFPLRQLANQFPRDKHALFLAYEQSRSFVDYITAQYGKKGLLDILRNMKAGDRAEEAVLKSLSKPLDTIEKEWLEQLKRKTLWLVWIGQYIYEILFFLAALLAVLAFVKLRIKRRRYSEEEEESEDGEIGPPS
jgi:hypothetical protein